MTSCGSTLRAAAADDQRPLRRAEEFCRLADRAVVDLGCRNRQRRLQRHRPGFAPHVDGAFEHRRSGPAGLHRPHGERRGPRRLFRLADQRRVVDQALDDAGLVTDFMKMAEIAADIGVGNLPDQAEHRSIGGKRGEQRRPGIEQPRARHHGEGLRLAGRHRRAQRHIGRALLVAGVDGAQPVLRPEQSLEQEIVLHARQGIDGVEAVADQRRDHRFGRRHGCGRCRLAGRLFTLLRHSCSWFGGECADRRGSVEALGA